MANDNRNLAAEARAILAGTSRMMATRDHLAALASVIDAQAATIEALQRAMLNDQSSRMMSERDRLRTALAALVGVDGLDELNGLAVGLALLPWHEGKAASLDAIRALIETLPAEEPKP